MTWYAAHIIQCAKFLDGVQDKYPCYENIVLVEAESPDRAREEAIKIGRTDYDTYQGSSDEKQRSWWEGRPVEWVFAGIRKLIACTNMSGELSGLDPEFRPNHGTEITYSQLEVDSEDALNKLISGDGVVVLYEE